MRVTVAMVLGQLAGGKSIDELLVDYPYLARDDILASLRYAAVWAAVGPHGAANGPHQGVIRRDLP